MAGEMAQKLRGPESVSQNSTWALIPSCNSSLRDLTPCSDLRGYCTHVMPMQVHRQTHVHINKNNALKEYCMGLRIFTVVDPSTYSVLDKWQLPKVRLAHQSGCMISSPTSKQPSEKDMLSYHCCL